MPEILINHVTQNERKKIKALKKGENVERQWKIKWRETYKSESKISPALTEARTQRNKEGRERLLFN